MHPDRRNDWVLVPASGESSHPCSGNPLERQTDASALAFTATQAYPAAETLHDPLHQHQPDTQPALLGGEEWAERHPALFFVHAFAGVAHGDADAPGLGR